MKKTTLLSILVVAVQLTIGVVAEAQHPTKIPRIGILIPASASFFSARLEAFRQRLGIGTGNNKDYEIDA